MTVLDTVADRQAGWSVTANKLKAGLDRARWAVFIFSVLGALLATLASQLGPPVGATLGAAADPRTWLAIAGAHSLATATFFTQRLLGQEHITGWVRARAISEALKREAYKFAAGATPYDQANAENLLNAERQKIEDDGDDLIGTLVTNPGAGSVPRATLTPLQYIERRVDGQIEFYKKRADLAAAHRVWIGARRHPDHRHRQRHRQVDLHLQRPVRHRGVDGCAHYCCRRRARPCRGFALRFPSNDISCHRAATRGSEGRFARAFFRSSHRL